MVKCEKCDCNCEQMLSDLNKKYDDLYAIIDQKHAIMDKKYEELHAIMDKKVEELYYEQDSGYELLNEIINEQCDWILKWIQNYSIRKDKKRAKNIDKYTTILNSLQVQV